MNVQSFALSLMMIGFLSVEWLMYRRFDFSFLQTGSNIRITKSAVAAIFGATVLLFGSVTALIVYRAGPELLQGFYILFYSLGWAVQALLLLRLRLKARVLAALGAGLIVAVVSVSLSHQAVQNIIMAGSLLWVGPFIAHRFRLNPRWTLLGLAVFAFIDTVNVMLITPRVAFSDSDFLLNGFIAVGDWQLGIGDFVFGYVIISLTQKFFGNRPALWLAWLTPLPRLFIRAFLPQLADTWIPYSLFMVLPTAVVFAWFWTMKHPSR